MGIAQLAAADRAGEAVTAPLRPAVAAFDAAAPVFDSRFGQWLSVAAQRRAVRAALLRVFPARSHILELGGGTGEDAMFLSERGFNVFLTDPSPGMVSLARVKLAPVGAHAEVVAAEELEDFALRYLSEGSSLFDGAFSNFAPLNCVTDLEPVARGVARLLKPGAAAILVLFGTFCPGEMATEVLRGRPRQALRRLRRGEISARIGKQNFHVVYHRRAALLHAFARWFVLEKRLGIGVIVPPSAAEPWISNHPRLLGLMETMDRTVSRPLAVFGDHVVYQFRRNAVD